MTADAREPIRRAIVVDDELVVRQLTIRALTAEGFRCDAAADGVEALRMAGETTYDLLVTDLRMPNGHGHGLAVSLLGNHDRPVIMILTGIMDPRIAKDLLARGVDDIVFKPVDYLLFALKASALVRRRHTMVVNGGRDQLPLSSDGQGEPAVASPRTVFPDHRGTLAADDQPPVKVDNVCAARQVGREESSMALSPTFETEKTVVALRSIDTSFESLRSHGEAVVGLLHQRLRDLEEALAALRSHRMVKTLGIAATVVIAVGGMLVLVTSMLLLRW